MQEPGPLPWAILIRPLQGRILTCGTVSMLLGLDCGVLAPTGPKRIAQGIALGYDHNSETLALKGRHRAVPPFQGGGGDAAQVPRALPWAILFAPFRVGKTARSPRDRIRRNV